MSKRLEALRRHPKATALILVAVLVVGLLAVRYVPFAFAARDAREAAQTLGDEISQLQIGDIDGAHLADLRAQLGAIDRQIGSLQALISNDPLLGIARNLGGIDRAVADFGTVLTAADQLSGAGKIALDLGDRFVALRDESGGSGQSLVAGMTGLIADSEGELDRAHDLMASAQTALTTISPDAIGDIREAAGMMNTAIAKYEPWLDQLRAVGRVLPGIVGWGTPRRYLILAQDPAELRPSGGYTGTVGLVGFKDGNLAERDFHDVYEFDILTNVPFVDPPDELANHLIGDSSWQLADANWSPDFPTTAQDALRLYTTESRDANVDGVIALTTDAVDRLLEVTGPVEVPEYGVTVKAGDVTMTALALTRGISNAQSDRKAFLDDLANTVIDRLYSLPEDAWPALYQAFADMSSQRMIQVWFKDPVAQSFVANSAIGGAVRRDPGDYLYVVEANVAPTSKYNLVVDRSDALSVTLAPDGSATSTLRLDWQNNSQLPGEPYASIRDYSTSKAGIYGAYVRVLVPDAAQLQSTSGQATDPIDSAELESLDAARAVFGNFLLMSPGPSDLTYQWTTPGVATQANGLWTYQLTIQKQPGLRPVPVTASITLPQGAQVNSVSDGTTVANGVATFTATLTQDTQVRIIYRLP